MIDREIAELSRLSKDDLRLTHEGGKVERRLLLLVHGPHVGSLEEEEGGHVQVAIVGRVMEGGLP